MLRKSLSFSANLLLRYQSPFQSKPKPLLQPPQHFRVQVPGEKTTTIFHKHSLEHFITFQYEL